MTNGPFKTMLLTNSQRRCFLATIASCERFIEQHADTDVPSLRQHVEFCERHRAELLEMLGEPPRPRRCHIVRCLINNTETPP